MKVGDRYEYITKLQTMSSESSLNGSAQLHTAMQVVSTSDSGIKWSFYVAGGRSWGPSDLPLPKKELKETLTTDLMGKFTGASMESVMAKSSASYPILEYPTEAVGIGETWAYTPQDTSMSGKVSCTLKSVSNGRGLVEAVFDPKDEVLPSPFLYLIDMSSGMIIASAGRLHAGKSGAGFDAILKYERLVPTRVRYPESVDNVPPIH